MARQDFIARYNQLTGYFWLLIAAVSTLIICYKCVVEGPETWVAYFVVPVVALGTYFLKRWMSKRMHGHLEEMNAKKAQNEQ
ncbi:MAG: hypothetical protein RLZZ301_615 [Bacteroidota bacterium]|jgi:membrane protein insertase Oxa1/YidC/SpoIIIJ